MAISGADTRREPGAGSTQTARPSRVAGPHAPFGPTLALTVALAVACFAAALAVVMWLTTPVLLPPPLNYYENQTAESVLYAVAFALILPLALNAAPRLADTIAAGPNGRALSLLVAILVATLAVSILVARVVPGGVEVDALLVSGAWSVGAVALLARVRQARPWGPLLRVAHAAPYAWALAGALVFGTLLAFTHLGSISPVALALGAAITGAVLVMYARRGGAVLPRVPRRLGLTIDAAIIVLLLLAIPDLVVFGPGPPLGGFTNSVIQFHHDLWLGPANQVLAGRALLVDSAAQYGIAPIYLLAGWFQLAPIGYGTFGFIDGALFALLFAAGYSLLRIAGTPRWLAAGALAFAVVVLIYNLPFSVGSLPQHGPLRFGLPMVLILAAVAEARWPRRSGAARTTQFAVVGVASIWSLEAFAYALFTYAALACFQAWMRPGPGRLGWLAGRAARVVAACVAAQLIFVAATLAFAGEFPDYGWYVGFLDAFLAGDLAEITYDFSPWSAGLAVGGAYAASATAFILLVRRRCEVVEREPVALLALCGTTAYGIGLFSYFVDRSPDHALPYVSLPAVLAGTLWLSLLLRRAESRHVRLGGLAFAMALAVLLLAVAWSSIGARFPRSALAHVVPGARSLDAAIQRLRHPPALDPRAPRGELLLDRYLPGARRVVSIVAPDLETEILIRSGRANALALGYALEDSFVPSQSLPGLRRTLDELEPGDRLLMQTAGLRALKVYETQPARDPLSDPLHQEALAPVKPGERLAPLQEWALKWIGRRYTLRVIHRDERGFVVASLAPRLTR
jgi:hypothetical protein